MAKKLSDEDLISILRKEEQVAQNWQDAELLNARQDAFDYYDRNVNNQAFGKEEGQSSVVTSEFADTVESVMPGLMRVFASGDEIAKFTPLEEADEQAAKEATQYVPHVVMRENDGFRILYWFFKDVLMYRLATLTVDVEEVEKTRKDAVEGWTEEQMAMAEEVALEKGFTDVEFVVEQDAGVLGTPLDTPDLPPLPTFSGTITTTRKKKRVRVDNVAPEDLLVSPADTRDIDEASFCGYRKQTTASALRVLGLSEVDIDGLSANRTSSPEEDQRQSGQSQSQPRKDDQRRLWLVVAYVKADVTGDGISSMLRVVYAHAGGDGGAIIERMEWEEGEAPVTIGSAILMSHSIVGRSLFDQTQDLQDVGTAITRGMLDNIYSTNRPRPMINSRVNINSVLDWTPGMPIQIDQNNSPADSIAWLQVPSIIEPALAALGYLENKRDQRTGTSRLGNNMDSDALSDASRMTKGGTSMVMSVSQERQELMANTLAATAITRLMRHVYRAIKRAATGPTQYFAKEEWQQCDPTKWPDDMHLVVNVGTSNKQQEQMNLLGIGGAQEKIWTAQGGPGPGLQLEHIVNTGRRLAEASGYRSTTQFFPSSKDVQQAVQQQAQQGPQIPPEVQAEQAKTQGALQAEQAKTQGAIQVQAAQNEDAMRQMQAEAAAKLQEQQGEAQLKQMELAAKQQEQQLDAQFKAAEIELKREEISLKRLELAHKRAELEMQQAAAVRDQEHERVMAETSHRHESERAAFEHSAKAAEPKADPHAGTAALANGLRDGLTEGLGAVAKSLASPKKISKGKDGSYRSEVSD